MTETAAFQFIAAREAATDALGMVGMDFPHALIDYVDETGDTDALANLVAFADKDGYKSVRHAWAWLIGSGEWLTTVEAVAWLAA